MKKKSLLKNKLRIIAGRLKGRVFRFSGNNNRHLRPTLNVVRETLFNWLAFSIKNAVCLDAFGGSGSLSFEAVSRGAKKVIVIEKDRCTFAYLKKNVEELGLSSQISCLNCDFLTLDSLENELKDDLIDIVFLDPPYSLHLISQSLMWIKDHRSLFQKNFFVYFEIAQEDNSKLELPKDFLIVKNKKRGNVNYFLVQNV